MRVVENRVYRGPSPYGYRPVIRITLDLEELEEWPSARIPGFNERLLELMPTLQTHGCSYGEPGGFVRRLADENSDGTRGTWMGHVIEHLALELQCLAGTEVTYGKTRSVSGQPGVYHVVYSFVEERVGLEAGADDYVIWPCSALELQSRIEARWRFKRAADRPRLHVGALELDVEHFSARLRDEPQASSLHLTKTEFQLLYALAKHVGQIVTRRYLMENVWTAEGVRIDAKGINTHMTHLRRKLGRYAEKLKSHYGLGYSLMAPARRLTLGNG